MRIVATQSRDRFLEKALTKGIEAEIESAIRSTKPKYFRVLVYELSEEEIKKNEEFSGECYYDEPSSTIEYKNNTLKIYCKTIPMETIIPSLNGLNFDSYGFRTAGFSGKDSLGCIFCCYYFYKEIDAIDFSDKIFNILNDIDFASDPNDEKEILKRFGSKNLLVALRRYKELKDELNSCEERYKNKIAALKKFEESLTEEEKLFITASD